MMLVLHDPSHRIEPPAGLTDLEAKVAEMLDHLRQARGRLTLKDFAGLDQFHLGGLAMTERLADLAQMTSKDHVLDIGCGFGGPARVLAQRTGCRVTGIEINPIYRRVGDQLTRAAGLADRVEIRAGNALKLDLPPKSFDVIWLQHVLMNIPKASLRRFIASLSNLLKGGGRLVIHEVVAGQRPLAYFPVPWAQDATMNPLHRGYLLPSSLCRSGFVYQRWQNWNRNTIAWIKRQQQRAQTPPDRRAPSAALPHMSLNMVFGAAFPQMIDNVLRNLREQRLSIEFGVLKLCPGYSPSIEDILALNAKRRLRGAARRTRRRRPS